MERFKVHILGCGSALPTRSRFLSSQVVSHGRRLYMIDCGEGAQIQFRKLKLSFSQLGVIFISHLHGDHIFGLPGLLCSFSLLGRTAPLTIYGPQALASFIAYIKSDFGRDIHYDISFVAVDTNKHRLVYEDKALEVWSIPLRHRIDTTGFLFKEKPSVRKINKPMLTFYNIPIKARPALVNGADYVTEQGEVIANDRLTIAPLPSRSYAYCSDTAFFPSMAERIKGVDLLFHEATFAQSELSRAKETSHSTAMQAAEIARLAGVKRLMIGHYSARYADATMLQKEAQTIFEFTILSDEELIVDI